LKVRTEVVPEQGIEPPHPAPSLKLHQSLPIDPQGFF